MKRNVLPGAPRVFLVGLLLAAAAWQAGGQPAPSAAPSFGAPLPIPPLATGSLDGDGARSFTLTAREGSREFLPGRPTPTLGYNGDYLGPTLLLRRGERVRLRVENALREPTTVHWHGAHLPAEMDGSPRQPIAAGAAWEARFEVRQPAATLWYHPHLMGDTSAQVYAGLAGLLLVEDGEAARLGLPRTYGVDDLPLVLQERRFRPDGSLLYEPLPMDIMQGFFGNAVLANGALQPFQEVAAGWTRLRLLNGSNSTILRLHLGGGRGFQQVAGDGGFLERPVPMRQVILSPGERAEVLVDFSGAAPGTEAFLLAENNAGRTFEVLKLLVGRRGAAADVLPAGLPARLARLEADPGARAVGTRRFVLSTGMGMGGMGMGAGTSMTINGRSMDMERIDERVRLGSTEVWEVVNQSMGMGMMRGMMAVPHSFHVHGLQFRILSINGREPPENERGWKDTVLLWPGDAARLALTFADYGGIYMYHCHLLEHEDEGMMGQFEVLGGKP